MNLARDKNPGLSLFGLFYMPKHHYQSESEMKKMMKGVKMGMDMTMMSKPTIDKAQSFVSKKISKIMHEGVRGKKVSPKQAVAIAFSMAREKGFRVPRKKERRRA